MRFIRGLAVSALIVCGVACGQGPAAENGAEPAAPPREKIVIGRVPSGNVLDISERMEALVGLIQDRLNVDVQVKFAADYAEFTRHMENQEYDLAFCAPFQYIQAHEKTRYEAALRPVRFGADTYVGLLITARPEITDVSMLKSRRIAFVDPRSTSGYLFPLGLLADAGVRLSDIQPFFLKGHDNVVLNVISRNYDAGACYGGAEVTYGKDQAGALRVLARTEPIYNEPIAFSPRFRDERIELCGKFIRLMTSLQDSPDGLAAITRYGDGLQRFVVATDTDYNTVRVYAAKLPPEVIRESGL